MAEVGNLSVSMSLDDVNFQRSLASMNRSLLALGQEIKGLQNKGKDWGSSLDGLRQKQDAYSRLLEQQQERISRLTEEYERAKAEQGEHGVETERLAVRLSRANAEMERTARELGDITSELQVQEEAIRISETSWGRLSSTLESAGSRLQSIGTKMTEVGKSLSLKLTAPLAALGTASSKAAIDFESAFAGVKKTVDTNAEGFAKLEKGILEMSRSLPASASDIAGVAEAAGQLGIAEENILEFTKTIIDLGESTNLSLEQASSEFARFANITGMSQQEFDKLGSSIVDLGNNFATTEAEIMSMGMRLAGQGAQVNMSESQILALAATMSSLGIEAEAGGTAMSTILKKLQFQIERGGETLDWYAEQVGLTGQQMKDAWNEGSINALDLFVNALSDAGNNGENLSAILTELDIKGIREQDTLLRMAGAADLLSQAVETSSNAWDENTALTNEANQRYETTASKLGMLKNRITEVAISFGQAIIPALQSLVDKLAPVIEKFASLDEEKRKLIVTIGAVVAAVGPVLLVFGKIITVIGSILSALAPLTSAIASAGGVFAALGGTVTTFGTVLAAITGPIGLAVVALGAVVGAGIAVGKALSKDALPEIERFGESVSEATVEALTSFNEMSDSVSQTLMDLRVTSSKVTGQMATELTEKYEQMNQQIVEGMNKRYEDQVSTLEKQFLKTSVLNEIEKDAILNNLQEQHEKAEERQSLHHERVLEIYRTAAEENRKLTEQEETVVSNINRIMNENAINYLSENEVESKILLERMKQNAGQLTAEQAAKVVKNSNKQKNEGVKAAEEQYNGTIAEIIKMRDEMGVISEEQAQKMINEATKQKDQTVYHVEKMHEDVINSAKEHANEYLELIDWETGESLSKWEVFKNNFKEKTNEIWENFKTNWSNMLENNRNTWEQIREETAENNRRIAENLSLKWEEMKKSVHDKMNEIKESISNIWQEVELFFSNINLFEIGKNIMQGLLDGIASMASAIWDKAKEIADSVKDSIAGALGIQSPSRVMIGFGENIGEGLVIGMNKMIDDIEIQSKQMANAATGSYQQSYDYSKSFAPVVNITSGNSDISSEMERTLRRMAYGI